MKRTLIAVCGLAPQIITETFYALFEQGRPPNQIQVLTTRSGRDACLSQLFDGGNGAWYRLLATLDIASDAIDFSPRRVIAVTNARGQEITDISDEMDNEAFLRACMRLAWEHSRDPDETIFYSIAGGRKTMGAGLAFAVQAYGRPQDRVFHVLVSPEFENSRDFFFPPHPPVTIDLRDAKGEIYSKSTRYAQVQLIAMPFFSFRPQLDDQLLKQAHDPATLLASLVREERPQLIVDLAACKLIWKQRELDLRPAQMAVYGLLAETKKDAACLASTCTCCDACWLPQHELLQQQQTLTRLYRDLAPHRDPAEMSDSGIFGLTPDNFHSYRSKINRAIEGAFGTIDAQLLQIGSSGNRPGVRYGLNLERERMILLR